MERSLCEFTVPIDVDDNNYVSGWNASLTYGVVKPAGVSGGA